MDLMEYEEIVKFLKGKTLEIMKSCVEFGTNVRSSDLNQVSRFGFNSGSKQLLVEFRC
jgi:hypothetical protein